ncbi:MAG: O-antigen ligase family protein [Candidatus Kerfeldbacteria bacterium]
MINKILDNMEVIRNNIVLVIFSLLIFVPTFFTGEWNKWIQSFILVLVFLLIYYAVKLFGDQRYKFKNFKEKYLLNPNTYLIIFFIVIIVTSFFSTNKYKSFSLLFLMFGFISIYFVAYLFFNNWERFLKITKIIFFTGVVVSLISLIMYFFQSSSRASGFLYNANALGSYMIFSILLGLPFILVESKRRYLYFVGWISITLSLFLSFSYTAWVGLILPIIFFIIYFRKKIFIKRYLILLLLFVVIFLIVIVGIRYQQTNDLSESIKVYKVITLEHIIFSFNQRFDFNLAAFDIAKDNIITGSGYNTFQSTYGRYWYSIFEQPRYAHNYFIQTLSDIGVVGFLSFIMFIILLLKNFYYLVKNQVNEHKKIIILVSFLAILGSIIHSLFDFGWQFPSVYILFWILAGSLMALSKEEYIIEDSINDNKQNKNKIIKVGVMILALIILGRGITLLGANYHFQQAEISKINKEYALESEYLLKGYNLDPKPTKLVDYVQAKIQLSATLTKDDYIELEDYMLRLININNEEYFAHWMLGKVYFLQKKYDQAIIQYKTAIEFNPVFRPDFHYDLALVYYEQGDLIVAKQTIFKILDIYPEGIHTSNPNLPQQLAFLNLLLGRIYEDQDDIVKARQYYTISLELKPDFSLAEGQLKKLY